MPGTHILMIDLTSQWPFLDCHPTVCHQVLSLSLPIPSGIVMPIMTMGAGFARLFGEISGYA